MKRKLRLAAPRLGTVKRTPSSLAAYFFLAPSLAGVTIFLLAPFVETVRRSFCDTLGKNFVGLTNYRSVLSNTAFRLAVTNTLCFTGVCVPLLLLLSLILALALRSRAPKHAGAGCSAPVFCCPWPSRWPASPFYGRYSLRAPA